MRQVKSMGVGFCGVAGITPNVLQLGEVADLEAESLSLELNFIRNQKLDLSTELAILPNCCYA